MNAMDGSEQTKPELRLEAILEYLIDVVLLPKAAADAHARRIFLTHGHSERTKVTVLEGMDQGDEKMGEWPRLWNLFEEGFFRVDPENNVDN